MLRFLNFGLFEGKIASVVVIKDNSRFYEPQYNFILSKEIIVFPKEIYDKLTSGTFSFAGRGEIQDRAKYVLYKIPMFHDERSKNSRFQIEFENGFRVNLILNTWNIIKLNFMHDRYWLFTQKTWFINFILSLVALLIALLKRK